MFFSLQADKIKQGIYTQLPNQNLNALKYLQKKQSTLGVTHNHTTRNTRILYRHHHGKAVSLQKWQQRSYRKYAHKNKTNPTRNPNRLLSFTSVSFPLNNTASPQHVMNQWKLNSATVYFWRATLHPPPVDIFTHTHTSQYFEDHFDTAVTDLGGSRVSTGFSAGRQRGYSIAMQWERQKKHAWH